MCQEQQTNFHGFTPVKSVDVTLLRFGNTQVLQRNVPGFSG